MAGGFSGKTGHNWVCRADGKLVELEACDQIQVNSGDSFVIETPGGGGYGRPST
jgi:5-oxoprolinase (ATP-hydrolysing)